MISLSDLSDEKMRYAKTGNWFNENVNRSYANNSVAFNEKPDMGTFLREVSTIYESKSGERGIFNRQAAISKCLSIGRDAEHIFGTNPCGEIILRSKQFCNLTEVVIKPDDTYKAIEKKVIAATILGTCQSTLTNFKYLSTPWKKNCEEERLLGVSLTGIFDNANTTDLDWCEKHLPKLREVSRSTNKDFAGKIGINPSAAITCVKPSGTVSQLVNSGSGIHPRYAEYYIRRVRNDMKDPLAQWMINKGIPYEVDIYNGHNIVFSFPIRASGSITRNQLSAIDHLKLWKTYRECWTDHNPSVTIYVGEGEWPSVIAWIWDNWDSCAGITFLPREDNDHVYAQAPYEEIDANKYEELFVNMPVIDFSEYEEYDDNTVSSQELACTAGVCEI